MADDKLSRQLSKIVNVLVQRGLPLGQARSEFEKQFIVASLRAHQGNLGRSARALGIHRNTLRNKILSLGIEVECLPTPPSFPPPPKTPR